MCRQDQVTSGPASTAASPKQAPEPKASTKSDVQQQCNPPAPAAAGHLEHQACSQEEQPAQKDVRETGADAVEPQKTEEHIGKDQVTSGPASTAASPKQAPEPKARTKQDAQQQ